MHLTGIRMGEFSDLEVDDNERLEAAMEKQQIDAIPLVTDAKPALSANESEVIAKLK